MAVPTGQWLDLIEREYLRRFVPMGGSGVKFVLGEDDVLNALGDGLSSFAGARGFRFAHVDAAAIKLHMIQDFFFALAKEIDWEDLAQRRVEAMFKELHYDWPTPGSAAPLAEIAAMNDVAEQLIQRNVDQWLTRCVVRDAGMTQDFREAMTHLCRRRMTPDGPDAALPILDWLRGDLRALGALRPAQIGARVTRHNARSMLRSLCHWLALSGCPGLVVTLDIRWIAEKLSSPAGIRYAPAAILDVFEVLRQLVDETDRMEGLFLVVIAGPALLDGEPRRTLDAYPALKGRIVSDVQARTYDNPLAPLVRLTGETFVPHEISSETAGDIPMSAERVAVEALRAGVPNEAAIRLLGGPDQPLTDRFVEHLRAIARAGAPPIFEGPIVAGGFGSGKSHLLGCLAEHAQNQNFIVSHVSISKETPLFNLERVFTAAMRNAVVPDINDDVMSVAIARLDVKSDEFKRLEAWASSPDSGLSPIFAALLHVLPRQVLAPEDRVAIARFFAGAKLGTAKIGQWLGAVGARRLFDVKPVKGPELALQRLRFAPALFRAVGFSGWCVLLDEVELIGRYSTLQRGKSYAELSRWLGLSPEVAVPGIIAVAAIVDDFKDVILDGRIDQEKVPRTLEAKNLGQLLPLAEVAMQTIERGTHRLASPGAEVIRRDLEIVRNLYERAYGWTPPVIDPGEERTAKTMREYVKSWITEWDIRRLYGVKADIEITESPTDYSENKDLESEAPPENGGGDL